MFPSTITIMSKKMIVLKVGYKISEYFPLEKAAFFGNKINYLIGSQHQEKLVSQNFKKTHHYQIFYNMKKVDRIFTLVDLKKPERHQQRR